MGRKTQRMKAREFGKRTLWEDLRFPMTIGAVVGIPACAMLLVAFGTSFNGIFLISVTGGSFLTIPLLIVGISRFMEWADRTDF